MKEEETKERLKKLKGWELSSDGKKIFRTFAFKTFHEAIGFIDNLAALAEKIKYYPELIVIRFPKVAIELTSREAGGPTEKDFMFAQETNMIFGWKTKLERWAVTPKISIILIIILLLIILWQYVR